MPDEMEKMRASMQMGAGDDGGGYLAGLGKLLVPQSDDPLFHLLAMANLSPRKGQAVMIGLNSYYRTTTKPTGPKSKTLDLWNMSDAPRLAVLACLGSISIQGRGRSELVDVLAGFTRYVKSSRLGRLFTSEGDGPQEKRM